MKRSLVHLMLGFLICITSLQGVAAELLAGCGSGTLHHPDTVAGKGADHHARSMQSDHAAADNADAAHAAQACAACATSCSVPVALPAGTVPFSLCHVEAGFQAVIHVPGGHIPDTPERPPRRHAA